ncbi:MAG: diphosphomevalonate decarboxylase [Legionellales bacterium]|nr:diphosphomevalonate decarboxylase [Legionellales bacterium]
MTLNKHDIIDQLLSGQNQVPDTSPSTVFAPINIALCKYWGKRDQVLNLPVTSSLSIALPSLGTRTQVSLIDEDRDSIYLNGKFVERITPFAQKLIAFLDLFRGEATWHLRIDTYSDVPVAAGLASSASGFAALVLALQAFFDWSLDKKTLSILARLGSGSACRSLWPGFVLWQCGERSDGMDSHGIPLTQTWSDLRIGLLIFHQQAKPVSSREAMQRTVNSSVLYQSWPLQVKQDLAQIQTAIAMRDIEQLGKAAENNALAMHATLMASWPPVIYSSSATLEAMQKIWQLRAEGMQVYFTQDAGPHLKLLFLEQDTARLKAVFENLQIVEPF